MPTEQAERFLDWARLTNPTMDERAFLLIEQNSDTVEGRARLAQAWVTPANERKRWVLDESLGGRWQARRLCLDIEAFIGLFPREERFIPPSSTTVLSWPAVRKDEVNLRRSMPPLVNQHLEPLDQRNLRPALAP
jgi:hypothetical protein